MGMKFVRFVSLMVFKILIYFIIIPIINIHFMPFFYKHIQTLLLLGFKSIYQLSNGNKLSNTIYNIIKN